MDEKTIKTQSEESKKEKSTDSKVFYVVKPSEEGIDALLDEIYKDRPEDDDREKTEN